MVAVPISGRRNFIINGMAQINQRGTAFTLVKDTYGICADRFFGMATGTAVSAGTLTRATSAPCGRTGLAFHFSGVTLTGTGILRLRYRMEAADATLFKNQKASFSAKIYHDVGSAINYTVYIRKANAADNFSAVTDISNSGAQSKASATELDLKYENISMGDCSNGIEIEIHIAAGAITTKNFYLTDGQFELGAEATAFEYRPYQEEFGLTQRYCQVYNCPDSAYGVFALIFAYSATVAIGVMVLRTQMRTKPAFTCAGTYRMVGDVVKNGLTTISVAADETTSNAARLALETTGLTAGNCYWLSADNDPAAKWTFSAEL